MLTPRIVKDIHDMQVREIERAIPRRERVSGAAGVGRMARSMRVGNVQPAGNSCQLACGD